MFQCIQLNIPMRRGSLKGEITDETDFAYIAEQDNVSEVDDKSTWI